MFPSDLLGLVGRIASLRWSTQWPAGRRGRRRPPQAVSEQLEQRSLLAAAAGDQFLVNANATLTTLPHVAQDASGDFVVTWTNQVNAADTNVLVQRFSAAGAPRGGPILVNAPANGASATGLQGLSSVAIDSDGDFVVVWTSYHDVANDGDIFAQRYSAAGLPQGTVIRVNSTQADRQTDPQVAMDAVGNFVVTWTSNNQDGSLSGLYAQRFNAAGVAQGGEFRVNVTTENLQQQSQVAMDADGDFVVTWVHGTQTSPGLVSGRVLARRFGRTGAPQGGEILVSAAPTGNQLPDVGMDADGDWVVTWTGVAGPTYGVFAQRFNAAGAPQGGALQVDSSASLAQMGSTVGVDADGDFVIAWQNFGAAPPLRIFAQQFEADGAPRGGGFVVNAQASVFPLFPAVAVDADGDIVVVWNDADVSGSGIFARQYISDATPVIGAFDTPLVYTENNPAILLDPNATIVDPDSPNFRGGRLTATLTANAQSADRLTIRHAGTAAGQIGVSGSIVTFGGIPIGTIDPANDGVGRPLAVLLNQNATPLATRALLRSVQYDNTSDDPSTAPRTVSVVLNDGDGRSSAPQSKTITVNAVNDAPVIGEFGGTVAYTENGTGVRIDSNATIADLDSADFNGGALTIAVAANGQSTDRLTILNEGTGPGQIGVDPTTGVVTFGNVPIGVFTGGTGATPLAVSLNAAATPARVQRLLRSVLFSSTSDNPSTAPRTVRATLTDGDGGTSNRPTKTLDVIAVNDPPVIGAFAPAITFIENGAPLLIDGDATLADPDSPNFVGGTLTIDYTAGAEAADRLTIRNEGTGAGQIGVSGRTVSFGGAAIGTIDLQRNGVGATPLEIRLEAGASLAAVRALLRNIQYQNVSDNPSATPRTVRATVSDGDGGTSNRPTKTINVTPVNDAPVLGAFDLPITYIENGDAVLVDSDATISDLDSADFAGGALTISGGLAGDVVSIRNQGTAAGQIGVNGAAVTFGGVAIGTITTAGPTLSVSLAAAATPAATQALLRNILFSNPTADPVLTVRTLRAALNDGDGANSASNQPTKTANVLDAPAIVFAAPTTFSENTLDEGANVPVAVDPAATLVDRDSLDLDGGQLTVFITNAEDADRLTIRNQGTAAGEIGVNGLNVTFGGVAIGTILDPQGGFGTTPLAVGFNAAATDAAAQALLRNILFGNTLDNPATAARIVRAVVTDGDGGRSLAAEQTITIAPDNDAPTLTQFNNTSNYIFDTVLQLDADATLSDPDSTNFDGGFVRIEFEDPEDSDVFSVLNNPDLISINGGVVAFAGTPIGTTAGTVAGVLEIALGADATRPIVQNLIRSLTFQSSALKVDGTVRTMTLTVADGDDGVTTTTKALRYSTIVISGPIAPPPPAAAPVLGSIPAVDFVEQTPLRLAPGASVIDTNTLNLDGFVLTVRIAADGQASDRLTIRSQGAVVVNGSNLTFEGTAIGTFTGGTVAAPLTVNFGEGATVAAVRSVLRSLFYENTSDNPTLFGAFPTRLLSYVLTDDADGPSAAVEQLVTIITDNDAPVMAAIPATRTYLEDATPILLAPSATAADPDDAAFSRLEVAIVAGALPEDELSIRNEGDSAGQIGVRPAGPVLNLTYGGAVVGTVAGGAGAAPLVVTFQAASSEVVQAVLRNVQYRCVSDNPTNFGTNLTRQLQYVLTDGHAGVSPAVAQTVTVVAVNDAPTLGSVPASQSYTENAAPRLLAPAGTVTDPDSADFNGGILTVRYIGGALPTDRLTIRNVGPAAGQIGVNGVNVTFGGVPIGTFAGGTGAAALVVTFTASATPPVVEAVLQSVQYANASDNPTNFGANPTRTLQYSLTDGDGGTSAAVTQVLNVLAVNDPPVLGGITPPPDYTENGAPRVLAPAGTVADPDSANLNNGRLTIAYAAGALPTDRLTIRNQGTAAGQVGVSGADVTFGGVLIGTVAGGSGTAALVVTFNAAATPAAAQAVLRNVQYANVSDNPTNFGAAPSRTLQYTLTDGDGGTSASVAQTLNVTAVNDRPVLSSITAPPPYLENATPLLLAPSGVVDDLDSADFNTGTLTVGYTAGAQATDRLTIRNQGTAAGQVGVNGVSVTFGGVPIGTVAGGSGTAALVVTFNAAATPAAAQAVLRNVQYANVSDNPTNFGAAPSRTLQYTLTDGDGGTSAPVAQTLNVTAVNDVPTLTGVPAVQSYVENAIPRLLAPAAVVADPDSANFATGRLTVSHTTGELGSLPTDRLTIRNQGTGVGEVGVNGANVTFGNIRVGTFTGGAGAAPLVVVFNVNATPAAVQAVVQNVQYANLSENPTDFGFRPTRTLSFVLTDGDGGTSVARTQTVNVTAANDAPTLGGIPPTQTYRENADPRILAPAATAADADSSDLAGGALTVSITAGDLATDRLTIRNQGTLFGQVGVNGANVTFGGVLIGTFAGGGSGSAALVVTFNVNSTPAAVQAVLRNIQYANVSDNPTNFGANPTRTLRYVLSDGDGGASAPRTQTLNITAVNDAPTLGNFSDALSYTVGGPATPLDANATLADADSLDFAGGSLTVRRTAGGASTDLFSVRNQGGGPNQIGFVGGNVLFGGVQIGVLDATAAAGTLKIDFVAAATPAAVQALVRNLTFRSLAGPVGASTVRVTITDGDGGTVNGLKPLNVLPNPGVMRSAAYAAYSEWADKLATD